MTETEWLACNDSRVMLAYLGEQISERKIYLTASAFLRRSWDLLSDERSHRAIETLERYADGLASWRALRRAQGQAKRAFEQLLKEEEAKGILQGSFYSGRLAIAWHAAGIDIDTWLAQPEPRTERARPWLELIALGAAPDHYASDKYDYSRESPLSLLLLRPKVPPTTLFDVPTSVRQVDDAAIARERAAQAELLRDIFGNPFRPVVIAPAWRAANNQVAVRFAQGIYEEGAFERMPILADALEEAGCTEPSLLSHLRGTGPHVRGCWAVDALIGKGATSK